MSDNFMLRTNAPSRGYDHPLDRIGVEKAPFVPLMSMDQKRIVTEQLGPGLDSEQAIRLVGGTALRRLETSDKWENVHLETLGIDPSGDTGSNVRLDEYRELAGSPEQIAAFIEWFHRATMGVRAVREQVVVDAGRVVKTDIIDGSKGHALMIGTANQLGEWALSKTLGNAVKHGLVVLENEAGWNIQRRTYKRSGQGRHKVAFAFYPDDPRVIAGLHIVRERPYADLPGPMNILKRSESFLGIGKGLNAAVIREVMSLVAKNIQPLEDNDEWLRIDNDQIDGLPSRVKELIERYLYSIHHHDTPTVDITQLSTSYLLRKPAK